MSIPIRSPSVQGHPVDLLTQRWVRLTGRRLRLVDHPWLRGPVGNPDRIGDEWIERESARLGGHLVTDHGSAGLLASMELLKGPGFDPAGLRPEIADFYERTTEWRLELWSQWCPIALPFGWVLSSVFSRRLQQLSLPLRPLDVAKGIDSRIVRVVGESGTPLGAAWLRTLRATGQMVYSGWYGTVLLPGSDRPSVRVVFPLPNGSATVFLRPEVVGAGDFRLVSPMGAFGSEGMYLVVHERATDTAWVRRVPIAERFDVYVDSERDLRTDHDLRLGKVPVIRLHYRLERRT